MCISHGPRLNAFWSLRIILETKKETTPLQNNRTSSNKNLIHSSTLLHLKNVRGEHQMHILDITCECFRIHREDWMFIGYMSPYITVPVSHSS